MIMTLSVVLVATALLCLLLYFLRKHRSGLDKNLIGPDSQVAENAIEGNGGICFVDADGHIGTTVSRRKLKGNLPDDTKYDIPEFLRR